MITINIDENELKKAKAALTGYKNGFPKALYRALNKSAAGAQTEMVNLIKYRYGHKITGVRQRIKVYKCTSYKALNASVRSKGPGTHLTDMLNTRQTKKGVTVNVKKSTGRKLIPHAFIAPGEKSGKKIVFIRETKDGKLVPRYDISALYTSQPEEIYNTDENWRTLAHMIEIRLDKNLATEVDIILKGY